MGSLTTLSHSVIMLVVIALVFLAAARADPAMAALVPICVRPSCRTRSAASTPRSSKQASSRSEPARSPRRRAADGRLASRTSVAEWSKRRCWARASEAGRRSARRSCRAALTCRTPRRPVARLVARDRHHRVVALLWLFTRSIGDDANRQSRRRGHGWLAVALASSTPSPSPCSFDARLRAGHDPALPAPRAHERIRPARKVGPPSTG